MNRKALSLLILVMAMASPARAVVPWYAFMPALSPSSTASTFGQPVNLTPPHIGYKYMDPIGLSFYVTAAAGENVTIRTIAFWANGSWSYVDRRSQGGEVDLTPLEVAELGYSGSCSGTSCTTSPFDGNGPVTTGDIVLWTFVVQSDQPNSTASVTYMAHFELH